MRHRKKLTTHFRNRDWGHVDSMMRNLLTSLCTHGHLTTTEKRAILLDRTFARLVHLAQTTKEERTVIREVTRHTYTEAASRALIHDIAPRLKDRSSGYLTFTPIRYRAGDNAKLVKIALA